MTKKQKKVLIRIIISAVLLVAFKLICYLAPVNKYVELVLFLIPYLLINTFFCFLVILSSIPAKHSPN